MCQLYVTCQRGSVSLHCRWLHHWLCTLEMACGSFSNIPHCISPQHTSPAAAERSRQWVALGRVTHSEPGLTTRPFGVKWALMVILELSQWNRPFVWLLGESWQVDAYMLFKACLSSSMLCATACLNQSSVFRPLFFKSMYPCSSVKWNCIENNLLSAKKTTFRMCTLWETSNNSSVNNISRNPGYFFGVTRKPTFLPEYSPLPPCKCLNLRLHIDLIPPSKVSHQAATSQPWPHSYDPALQI